MYIEKEEFFDGLKIRMRLDLSGQFADIFADENFYKANGYSSSKEMAYLIGCSADQVKHPEKVLPRWVRFYADGRIGESPFVD